MTTGHPHWKLMNEYAEVARTNPKPWTEFEARVGGLGWCSLDGNPNWGTGMTYRRKPKPPKKIKFEAWKSSTGELRFFVGGKESEYAMLGTQWVRLPLLDIETEVQE